MTAGLPLMKSVLKPLAKSVTIWIISSNVSNRFSNSKKINGSGITALIISNEEMKGIMKIIKFLEESGLLIKELVKQLKMNQNNKKKNFFQCYLEY